jgi:hypothetical protein
LVVDHDRREKAGRRRHASAAEAARAMAWDAGAAAVAWPAHDFGSDTHSEAWEASLNNTLANNPQQSAAYHVWRSQLRHSQ